MSISAPEWFTREFVEGVIHKYQDKGGRLLSTVRRKSITNAADAQFNVLGVLEAYDYDGVGDLREQGAEHSNVRVTTQYKKVTPVIRHRDLSQMAADDRDELKKAAAKALARAADNQIITALNTSGQTVRGGSGEFMSPAFSESLNEIQAEADIDDDDIFMLISPRMHSQLMRFDEYVKSDYSGPDLPWMNKSMRRTWNGKHWIQHNKLPKTGNLRRGFQYARNAVGHATLEGEKTIITWENLKDFWFVNSGFQMGCKPLLPEGITPFDIDESIKPLDIDPAAYTAS
jgi:hypothetical protein